MTDTKNWRIRTDLLKEYKQPTWSKDYFQETFDSRYGVYIYNIDEWRMLSYAGLIAIFSTKPESKLLLNSSKTWISFDDDDTFDYLPISDCLVFRKPSYKEHTNKPGFPFLLIKPVERSFAFIPWDGTSIYYGFGEIRNDVIKIREVHSGDLDNLQLPKRTNEEIDLSELKWFSLDKFDNALNIYHASTK